MICRFCIEGKEAVAPNTPRHRRQLPSVVSLAVTPLQASPSPPSLFFPPLQNPLPAPQTLNEWKPFRLFLVFGGPLWFSGNVREREIRLLLWFSRERERGKGGDGGGWFKFYNNNNNNNKVFVHCAKNQISYCTTSWFKYLFLDLFQTSSNSHSNEDQ